VAHKEVETPYQGSPRPIDLTIWGDPIIGQALVLLLRSSGYKAKFLLALPSSEALSPKEYSRLLSTSKI
jgi:hypothetical protein